MYYRDENTDFDFFVAKTVKEEFKRTDPETSIEDFFENEWSPIIYNPTDKFYDFAKEGSDNFFNAWEELASEMPIKEVAGYDKGYAMEAVLEYNAKNYTENCKTINEAIEKAEKDIEKYVLNKIPYLKKNAENNYTFDGTKEEFSKNWKEIETLTKYRDVSITIERPEETKRILDYIKSRVSNYNFNKIKINVPDEYIEYKFVAQAPNIRLTIEPINGYTLENPQQIKECFAECSKNFLFTSDLILEYKDSINNTKYEMTDSNFIVTVNSDINKNIPELKDLSKNLDRPVFVKEVSEGKVKSKIEIKNGKVTDKQLKEHKQENKTKTR